MSVAGEIVRLLHRYTVVQDAADFAAVAHLFRHATYRVAGGPVCTGEAEVLAMKTHHDRTHDDGTLRTKHVTTNSIIEVAADGRSATARSVFVVLQATPALPLQPVVAGRYLDTFAPRDGSWCFTDRLIVTDLIGDLGQHIRDNPLA
jgi:hypothetical protein